MRILRIQRARQPYRAQVRRAPFAPGARELPPDESIVESHVVRHEHATFEPGAQFPRNVVEGRRVGEHVVVDAGERRDAVRNAPARIHQALPFELELVTAHADHGHIDDAVPVERAAGGLDVDEGERRVGSD